jgi:kynurenine formamidase
MNFVSEGVVLSACSVPQEGRVISCAIDFHADGPMLSREPTDSGARYNVRHRMTVTGEGLDLPGGFQYADDSADLTLQSATQWDALSHVFYDGQMYNGFSSSLVTQDGAGANAIDQMRHGVVTRGILLDIARYRGLPWLPDGTAILPDELEDCAHAQGFSVRSGDVVLIRTGRVGRALKEGWTKSFVYGPNPGLSIHCAGWLFDSMVAAVAVDNVAVEVQPGEVDDCMMPLHMIALRNMGLTFGEIFNLEELGERCASLGRFEFLFVAPPLPILGAVGSPINPLAIL